MAGGPEPQHCDSERKQNVQNSEGGFRASSEAFHGLRSDLQAENTCGNAGSGYILCV
ncbi:hypothetical protein D3C75_883640 [compost metagenome]